MTLTDNEISEVASNGDTVGISVLSVDGDVGSTIVDYSLIDNAGGRFAIDPATGIVTVFGCYIVGL